MQGRVRLILADGAHAAAFDLIDTAQVKEGVIFAALKERGTTNGGRYWCPDHHEDALSNGSATGC